MYILQNLSLCRVALEFMLGENGVPVNVYLKASTLTSHKRNALQLFPKLLDNFACQPGGALSVVSLLAVENGNFHIWPP